MKMKKYFAAAAMAALCGTAVAGQWRQYEGNPVLGNAKLGTCFDVNVVTNGPAPYTMYFSWRPQKAIALVRSTDGFKWTQEPEICLRRDPTIDWEESDLNRSCTVLKDGIWHMWYTGQSRNYTRSMIGYATSKDGVHFTRVTREPVMKPDRPYEKESVMNPYVRWDAARKVWRMWYAAGETYEPNVLCYAESADGLVWKKWDQNPIFVHGAPQTWDRARVGACEVHPLPDGRWAMFYIGYSDIDTARIGCAVSADGITGWTRLGSTPIVAPDLGTWNGSACYKPSVVRDEQNQRWLLWYNGRNGRPEYVGMAVHEGLDLEAPASQPLNPSTSQLLSFYVRRFNAHDVEHYTNAVCNAEAEAFMLKNCPRLACPDKDIERTYYFRWWTFRKHLRKVKSESEKGKSPEEGWRVTEFLPKVGWSGTDNTIVCPAGHHLREGRWLRDPQYLADDARFWLASPQAEHRWGYSSWLFTATRLFAEVTGLDTLPDELLDDAIRYYERWVKGFPRDGWPEPGKIVMGGDGKGGFVSIDNYEGTEISLGGHGYKPLLASAMWSEAKSIAAVARAAGRTSLADEYERKAEVTRQSILANCWNPEVGFFTTARTNGVKGVVRELHGYAPWYFGMPTDGREPDWAQLADPEGFAATYGLAFPERRAKGFTIDYKGHECKWNGPSWPFATSIAITALMNHLHSAPTPNTYTSLFTSLLWQYADAQRRTRDLRTEGDYDVVPWIDENLHPDKPQWLSRKIILDTPAMVKNFPRERGKDYNHSTFCDLVISGLVGFQPNGAKGFKVDPLFPADWDYLVLEDLRYRGHDVSIRWQRGKGLEVLVDGRLVARRETFGRLDVSLAQSGCAERRISLEDYRDRMRGAWIGQIVGVSWGQPTEFRWNDAIIPKADVPEWSSDFPLKYAYGNDDLYVEMTFLRTLERYGLDVSPRQAGIDFANSGYELWCANREGRLNLRTGVAPPDCSHPSLNKCPNDIDYQIEADYAGIVSPGCPDEVIRLGGLFGRLMNFGDGVWAGEFVGALYAESFFTKDVDRLLDAGLRAIPAESDYAQMVRNVRAWHRASPDNWTNVWERIKSTYSKTAGAKLRDSNGGIDVRLNGACVVLGLLAGKGDLDASMEIAMRGGWDSDCNPSTVGGVLMCAAGAKALPAKYVEKLDYARKFSFTDYSLDALFAVCEKLARQIVVRQGGRIERDAAGKEWFVVPARQPMPEPFVPSWAAGKSVGSRFTDEEMARQKFAHRLPNPADLADPDPTVRVQKTLDALFAGWKTSANGESEEFSPGYRVSVSVLKNRQLMGCLLTNPPQKGGEVSLSRTVTVPPGDPKLSFVVANLPKGGEFGLRVRVDGATVLSTTVSYPWADEVANGYARTFEVSLQPWVGQTVRLELVDASLGGERNEACWHDILLTSGSGTFGDGVAAAVPLSVDFGRVVGPMKPLHGVNNAPMRVAEGSRQDEFAAAGIPFVRTHDTAGMWGGAHYVDIPNVFPDFDADENDPASYDFAFTDAYLKPLVEAGCQPFYRLGVTIENYWKVKAYHIAPPKDFAKWARICEHVVRHYNDGWANGFRWNLVYWEIWNEPENPPMWQGTREQFFELYRVTANHLKTCFPQIRVGGYAGCGFYSLDDAAMKKDAFYAGFLTWFEDFVKYVQDPKTKAPLDFYSWHLYVGGDWTIDRIGVHADYVRRTLDAAGLAKTESIFDEWNVFEGRAHRGFDAIKEPPAAARVMAAFALMQAGTVDKAMYYDALPTRSYCGLFYFPSIRTTPTYEAFRAFDHLYRMGESVGVTSAGKGVYACAAKGTNGKAMVVANVGAEVVAPDLKVDGADGQTFRVYRLDERHRVLTEDGTWRAGERLEVPKDGFVLLTTVGLTSVKQTSARPAVPLNGIEANDKKRK